MKNTLTAMLLVAMAALLTSAVSIKGKDKKITVPEGYAFVPSGTVSVDSTKLTVQSFFISRTEVTNKQYRTFLADLKAKGDTASYRRAMVDSNRWLDKKMYMAPYAEFYFCHPAYDNYPVVNISYEGAALYCKWLTEKMASVPGLSGCIFRLPCRAEWIMAARGGSEQADYSWDGPYLRGGKKGMLLCNFKTFGAECIHYDAKNDRYEVVTDHYGNFTVEDNYLITALADSYEPNAYGLYNMCGNTAEMVQEKNIAVGGCWNSTGYDVRVESTMAYDGEPSIYVGFRPVVTYVAKS